MASNDKVNQTKINENVTANTQQFQYNPYMYMMQMQPQMMQMQPQMMQMQSQMMPMYNQMMQIQPQMMQIQPQMIQMQPQMMPMYNQMQPQMQQPQMQQPQMQQPQMQQPQMQPMYRQINSQMQPEINWQMQPQANPILMQENPIIQSKNVFNIDEVVNKLDERLDKNIDSNLQYQFNDINNDKNKKRKLDNKNSAENSVENPALQNPEVINLANKFDNVLDNSRINKKQKTTKDVSFLPYKDGRNVIKYIRPLDLLNSNFNNETHPEEKYYVEFLDGKIEEKNASDINQYALITQSITYIHNNKIANENLNANVLPNASNTVIYTRCSKSNDISIETQKQACLKYAKDNNMKMAPFGYLEDNGISARNGKNFKSGELSFWLSHLSHNSDIIVYSPDRWSRNTLKGLQELDNLVLKKNITIHFVNNNIKYNKNTSSANKAMIQTELMTAEKQSNDTSEKIKGTLNRLKAEGHVIGRAPYGYTNVVINGIRKRIHNHHENENIKKIKHKYFDINENFDTYLRTENIRRSTLSILTFIMRWCFRNGMKNRNGIPFTVSHIKSIINSN